MDTNIIWLIAIGVFILLEAVTAQFVSIWFTGGGVAALIASLVGANEVTQITIFVIVSAILLIFTRPILKRFVDVKAEKTNSDSLIGKMAVITEKVDNLDAMGKAKIDGMIWTARSLDNSTIEAGETVTVEKIEGVKLIVKK